MKNKPYVSVIVCSYNGENRIKDCLNALINQDYQKDRYEIIVVDDGSKDKTSKVVSRYPVKLIKNSRNLGTYVSRNKGLRQAKGEIVAYTDDDCFPDKSWLKNLISGFSDKNVVAVGGITESYNRGTITQVYMDESGYGNPAPPGFNKSKSPLYRFCIYLKEMFFPLASNGEKKMEVSAIYTLNASFRKSALINLGGWDESLKYGGDTEMCMRIRNRLAGKKIIFIRGARVMHKHRASFTKFLDDIYSRNVYRIKYYLKHKIIPPIFPFPVFIVFITAIFYLFNPGLAILVLLFLPQLFYIWWPIKFFKNPKLYYFIFPYFQFALELASIAGMFKGLIKIKLGY